MGLLAAFGLSLAMAASISLARFSYAIILPAMRDDLGWSYTQAGTLNTINAVGYLIGSFLGFASVRRLGPKMPFVAGLWLTAATVLATAFVRDFAVISAIRLVSGVFAAYVFITGGVLAASIFPRDARRAASAIAIYFAGGGLGLLISAITLPLLLHARGDAAWPEAWLLLGVMSLVMSLFATLAARPVIAPPATRAATPWAKGPLWPLFVGYGCFALGYFAYMTFIVAWMREQGFGGAEIAMVWAALGLSTHAVAQDLGAADGGLARRAAICGGHGDRRDRRGDAAARRRSAGIDRVGTAVWMLLHGAGGDHHVRQIGDAAVAVGRGLGRLHAVLLGAPVLRPSGDRLSGRHDRQPRGRARRLGWHPAARGCGRLCCSVRSKCAKLQSKVA